LSICPKGHSMLRMGRDQASDALGQSGEKTLPAVAAFSYPMPSSFSDG
jgi:hypothetical protein